MRVLKSGIDLDAFFRSVSTARERVLFLDYDGTLAPFRRERDLAYSYAGVRERLARIVATGRTRLAVVGGRPLADLGPLLGLERPPELWGSHGKERRTGEALGNFPQAFTHLGLISAAVNINRVLEGAPAGVETEFPHRP